MLSKKIIASSITNLTDARYFAGWMVDYLHFDLRQDSTDRISIQQVGEFISWIEGPQVLLSVDEEFDLSLLNDIPVVGVIKNQKTQILGMPVIEIDAFENNTLGSPFGYIIDSIDDSLQNLDADLFFDVSVSDSWKRVEWIEGLVVHGGPEEKVGLKTFDELDELFEELSEWD